MKTKEVNSSQLMDHILKALHNNNPLSVISVGQTEATVIAQDKFETDDRLTKYQIVLSKETYIANLGKRKGFEHRGIQLPDKKLQLKTIEAVKSADIVGYNIIQKEAKELTETAFDIFNLHPKIVFEANIRRAIMFSQKEKFHEMLKKRKILLVGSLAPQAMKSLNDSLQPKLGFNIVDAITIYSYHELERVKSHIDRCDFDLCLLAAGTNATILAPYIAQKHGKVAFDIGHAMESFITGEIFTDEWINNIIGIENLLKL